MKYELDSSGLFLCDCPDEKVELENWTRVRPPQPCETPRFVGERQESGEWTGYWVDDGPCQLTDAQKAVAERAWRDNELAKADIEINKLSDAAGDTQALRDYRVALRDWPEHPYFPEQDRRPVAPGSEE